MQKQKINEKWRTEHEISNNEVKFLYRAKLDRASFHNSSGREDIPKFYVELCSHVCTFPDGTAEVASSIDVYRSVFKRTFNGDRVTFGKQLGGYGALNLVVQVNYGGKDSSKEPRHVMCISDDASLVKWMYELKEG